MANRWETMETVIDYIFLGSKITADSDCSHVIKRHLLLGRKAMTTVDNILKSRTITLPTNVHLVKAMVFPVVMYGCESWTVKKRLQFSSVESLSHVQPLRPHGLQHARPPCQSPTPRAYSNWCPLSRWSIQPSHLLLSPSPPTFNLFQH